MNAFRSRARIFLALAALSGGAAPAATVGLDVVSTSFFSAVSCTFAEQKAHGNSGCAATPVSGGISRAAVAADGGEQYGGFAGFFESGFYLAVRAEAQVREGGSPAWANASAEIEARVTVRTTGPVRRGFADFYALGGPFRCAWPECAASVSVGRREFETLGGYMGRPPLYTVPVLLGTDLPIVLRASAWNLGREEVSASLAGIDISFREDNTRFASMSRFAPSAMQEAPEPGPLVLLAVGVVFLLALSRRARWG